MSVTLAVCHLVAGMGGICRVARLMARALHDQGGAVTALDLLDSEPPEDLGIFVRTFRGNRPAFVWACHGAALRGRLVIYDQAGIARAHPRLPGFKSRHVVWLHGIEVWENARADHLAAARRADLLLCNTEYTKRRAQQLHGIFDRARVCWLGTEEDEPPPQPPRFDGFPTVLVVGRIDEGGYKGHRELIGCWPTVLAAIPDARLLIVGGGSGLDSVRELASASPASTNIEVTGFLPEERMGEIWRRAHTLAMPSRGEGFGLVYIEAMRRALPVIASVHDAAKEINLDGVTGFNVNLDQVDELPQRIITLLSDTALAQLLGRNGQARWTEHFRFTAFCDRFKSAIIPVLPSSSAF